MNKSRKILYRSGALALLIIFIAGISIPLIVPKRRIASSIICQSNLKQLTLCLINYASENQFQFPHFSGKDGLLTSLNHMDLDTPEILCCPTTKINYVYYGGVSGNTILQPQKYPMIWEDGFPHNDKKAVAFLDGHVELLTKEEWSKINRQ